MKLLVTGGAGYVGSCVATVLVERGHDVTIIDNLSTGTRDAVPAGTRFIEGELKTSRRMFFLQSTTMASSISQLVPLLGNRVKYRISTGRAML